MSPVSVTLLCGVNSGGVFVNEVVELELVVDGADNSSKCSSLLLLLLLRMHGGDEGR